MSVWSSMDGGGDDDWGLQAVVRGCRPTKNQAAVTDLPLFPATEARGDLTAVFPGLTEARTAHYELEELCKPFFPKPQHHHHQHLVVSPSRSNPPSPSSSAAGAGAGAGGGGPHRQRQPQRPASQTPRSKRRKNQQKRVVCHVPADGVSSDVWAWRKYGQKPIKGSPYPRGYYRCSSSKGCLARKQVERSRTDPGMLVITYTAEHNHPVPTHRNSLAGSTRHKFPTTTTAAAASSTDQPPSATSPTSGAEALSPTTPLTASMDEDQEDEDGVLLVEDMEVVGEDDLLFMGGGDGEGELDTEDQPGGATTVAAAAAAVASGAILEGDVVGGFEDQFFARPWRANHNAAAAAGGR